MGSYNSKPVSRPSISSTAEEKGQHHPDQARVDAVGAAALLARLHLSTQLRRPASTQHPTPEVSFDAFTRWKTNFERDDKAQLASTLLSKQPLSSALIRRQALAADKQVFSHKLTVQPTPVTNQKSSGRCWLFATCNVVRTGIVKKFNLSDFELSQSYLFFYDSLEKANYYLENMIDLVEEPIDSRIVSHLSSSPEGDGGQWDMVVALIEKYGIVPKSIYDESFNSSNSSGLKNILTSQLRGFALELRRLHKESKDHAIKVLGKDLESAGEDALIAVRQAKEVMLDRIYHCLAIALGTPPSFSSIFKWEYTDVTGKAHCLVTNPLEFYHKHCAGFKASEYISLINDPRHNYDAAYTVERLGNVWGGRPIRYVNTTSQVLKSLVIKMIKSDKPVWFGCDVGKMSSSAYGIMDTELIDYENGLGVTLSLSKAERLQMVDSAMTHAMVITAVHLDEHNHPVRFKVENSWSDTAGDHGYFMMTDKWFDEYVYQIVLPKCAVPSKFVDIYDNSKPQVLPPWDPMGSLA